MRGSNAKIVWRRARAARWSSTTPLKGLYFGCCVEPDASKKRPCTPILTWFHRSRLPPAAAAEARCLEGHARATGRFPGLPGHPAVTVFHIESLVYCTALASARPSRSSALRHGAPLAEVISTRWSPAAPMRACTQARCFSPYIPAFFCPVHTRESLAAPNLEYDYLTRKTGRMWPLWIAWQGDAETATGELERYSAPKDLSVQGGCSRTDIYIYLCLFVFTLVSLHMKWHIFAYVPIPGSSSNHIYIQIYS